MVGMQSAHNLLSRVLQDGQPSGAGLVRETHLRRRLAEVSSETHSIHQAPFSNDSNGSSFCRGIGEDCRGGARAAFSAAALSEADSMFMRAMQWV